MTTLYSDFVGGRGQQFAYYPVESNGGIEYPNADQYNVFPTLYLPRIYGKDLTAFEIASSGSIAITLKDVHSFDLDRNLLTSNVSLTTQKQDSFFIGVNSNQMSMTFDSTSNNLTIGSASNIYVAASNEFGVVANNFNANINGDISMAASNDVLLTGRSNVRIAATSNDVTLAAGSNFNIGASNNVDIYAKKTFMLAANGSNMAVTMDSLTNNTSLYTSNNLIVVASNDVSVSSVATTSITSGTTTTLSSASNTLIKTQTGTITLSNGDGAQLVLDSTTTLDVASNTSCTTGTSFAISARGGAMQMTLDAATDKGLLKAAGGWDVTSTSNITVTADYGSFAVYANRSNMSLVMSSNDNQTKLYSSNNIIASTSNDIRLLSMINTTVSASNTLALSSFSNAQLASVTGTVSVSAVDQASSIILSSNVDVATGKDMTVKASSNLVVAIHNSNMTLIMNGTSDTVTIATTGSTSVVSGSNVSVRADYGTLGLYANQSNVTITTNATTDALALYAKGGINLVASNDITTTSTTAIVSSAGSSNVILANNGAQSLALRTDGTFKAQASNYTFNVGASDIVYIDGTTLRVNGNVEIKGVVDSINVTNSYLNVQDKLINLAYTSNGTIKDGADNTGAGMIVTGVPTGCNSVTDAAFYEKSLKWNMAGGMSQLGTANFSNDSFWEMRGGGFRITHNKSATEELSFGFRINNNDELELVKKYKNGAGYVYKRVAKFGLTRL
jgi:uncharacterized protein (DUF2345 family)